MYHLMLSIHNQFLIDICHLKGYLCHGNYLLIEATLMNPNIYQYDLGFNYKQMKKNIY